MSYLVAAVDSVIVVVAAIVSGIGYHHFAFGFWDQPTKYLAIGLVFAAGFVLLMVAKGYYKPSVLVFFSKQLAYIVASSFILATFLALVVFLLGASDSFSRAAIALFAATSTGGIVLSRLAWAQYIRVATTRGTVQKKKVMLIRGAGHDTASSQAQLSDFGLEAVHVLDIDEQGQLNQLLPRVSLSISNNVSEIYVMTDGMSRDALQGLIKQLRTLPVPVHFMLDSFVSQFAVLPVSTFGETTIVELQRAPLNLAERYIKRGFDIVFASIAIFFFAPLMLLAAIAIKLDTPGPVFFRQQRRGFNNKPFDILKFRSMSVMESSGAMTQAIKNDSRITRVGRFIRSTSVDELPQFWNVLFGHMSVVGPRPHAVSQEDHYDQLIARYAFRRHVKPGITGWAQINGHRGATPTVSSMEDRLEHDLWYMHHWSLWLDIRIMLRTFGAMFDRKSAF
ncbi:MAG: undecaprenyl-phosphate glucose phosphotransferase [Candidatus Devosia phytovorans]|uniref:Undecaprenyl-phosphate glucose phosphotransferase n=1 Tax=Candidatus Devosia phytovorans TaxID=3121372 RepID=A0AAJ5VUP8_9HYPH|nr:undecaprenyl-phosphate glucose phosphotransferase [Devosia sp.]WEK03724.1 MAG: undecaprenyl-phosphate glucose phosphotransferase [Devosia sp.]